MSTFIALNLHHIADSYVLELQREKEKNPETPG